MTEDAQLRCPYCKNGVQSTDSTCSVCGMSLPRLSGGAAPGAKGERPKGQPKKAGKGKQKKPAAADDPPADGAPGEDLSLCPVCRTKIRKTDRACGTCGAEFEADENGRGEKGPEKEAAPQADGGPSQEELADCPMCGALVSIADPKCPKCGAEFEPEAPVEVHVKSIRPVPKGAGGEAACPICESTVSTADRSCPFCGAEFEAEGEAASVMAWPAPEGQPAQAPAADDVSCPVCARIVGSEVTSCPFCGAEFEEEAPTAPAGFVPNYGPELADDEVLCPVCGNRVGGEVPACPYCNAQFEEGEVEEVAAPASPGILRPASARAGDTRRGISNGTSAINGVSLVNGVGQAAGPSRINGTGATNGMDLINGRGVSNGVGAINGRRPNGSRRRQAAFLKRWQLLVIFIVFALALPAVLFFTFDRDEAPFTVDGGFDDWEDVARLTSLAEAESPSINVVEWSIAVHASTVYLYLETEAPTMAGERVEGFVLFIDTDGSADTGYDLADIGADVMVELQGWNGSAEVSVCSIYDDSEDRLDWNSWRPCGGVVSSVDGQRLEASAKVPLAVNGTSEVVLVSMDEDGAGCQSCAVPIEGSVLLVEQSPSEDLAEDGVLDYGAEVLVSTLTFTCLREAGTVESVSPELAGVPLLEGIEPFALEPGLEVEVELWVDATSLTAGDLVSAELTAEGVQSSFSYVQVTGKGTRAYAYAPPAGISVDGAFADWTGLTVADVDEEPVENPDIDIGEVGGFNDTAASYFYVGVEGGLFMGAYFPESCSKPGEGGGNGTVVPVRRTGEDLMTIYVDTDRDASTGLRVGTGPASVGAEMMVEVTGLMGEVKASSLSEYADGEWAEVPADIDVGTDAARMEIGIGADDLGAPGEVDFLVITTDWRKSQDLAVFIASEATAGRSLDLPGTDYYFPGPMTEDMPEFGNLVLPVIFVMLFFVLLSRRIRK
ncbi:MAG: hypothetical protein AB1793_08335 [Candidatus Thermoplasmatota archaeon]